MKMTIDAVDALDFTGTRQRYHLAEVLDRPLMLKRASDLQSKWLGEAEQNMARMFRDATTDGAVLLLDEADTFLRDRRGAEKSWEVSQVNEMLTQLETFHGVFIASTNLMESLDQAALRRFELKWATSSNFPH